MKLHRVADLAAACGTGLHPREFAETRATARRTRELKKRHGNGKTRPTGTRADVQAKN